MPGATGCLYCDALKKTNAALLKQLREIKVRNGTLRTQLYKMQHLERTCLQLKAMYTLTKLDNLKLQAALFTTSNCQTDCNSCKTSES